MSFSLPQSWSCLLKAVSVCYGGGQIMDLREMGKWKKLWGAAKLQSTRHDTSGCSRSRRGAVLALSSQDQTITAAPRAQAAVPCWPFQPQGRGSCGLGFPTSATPPPQQLGAVCTSCLVGWPGGLLNRPLFMGFSSARRANHLIP